MPRRSLTAAFTTGCAVAAVTLATACTTAARPAPAPSSTAGRTAGRVAPYTIAYRVAITDPAAHLYDVTVDVGGVAGDTLALQLPVWSPGRYARMDFARNVQGFAAATPDGRPLRWEKAGGSRWHVAMGGARAAQVRYRVYANTLSGTFSVLDTAHANWNGAGLFMYVDGHTADPVRLTVAAPAGWAVYNGASAGPITPDAFEVPPPASGPGGSLTFTFPSYDFLVDTPTEVAQAGEVMVDSFVVDGRTYRTVVHHNGGGASSDQGPPRRRFVNDVKRIVEYQNTVMGPPPLDRYTFLFNIGYAGGDGMEHLYSTQIINGQRWTDTALVLPGISTASHEYFHTWNVKRVRPVALGPFDYTREQHQPSLWVAEGWTQYYGDVTLHRAGIVPKERLYQTLGGRIRLTSTTPARKERSARQASFDAPFFDGGAEPMETNRANTFLTYYYKGEVLALALDLEIRAASAGRRSLDDVLRLLKQRTWDEAPNASHYLQGRGYTEADVERAASDVHGRSLADWFARYVGGTEDLPWDETLALAGLRLSAAGVLEERPDATPAQRRVRDGWLAGAGGPRLRPTMPARR